MKMNKRMLSLTLALVMILGSLSTVFGLEVDHVLDTEKKAGEFLYDNDVLIGGDGGNLFLDQNLTRRDSIVLLSRLLGEEDAAKNYKVGKYPTFTDVKKGSYYTPFAGWAQDNGYYKGGDDNKLYPMDHITARQYATVLLRALGYSEKEWNGVFEQAKDLGLFKYLEEVEEDTKITRGQMALMTVNALYQNLEGEEDKTLADKLEIDMPAIPEVEEEDFKVESVEAINAKHIAVKFNKALSYETAVKENNYTLTINTEKAGYGQSKELNTMVNKILVLNDEETVIFELKNDLDNGDKYSVDVTTGVKSSDGEKVERYGDIQKVFEDYQAPVIKEVVMDEGEKTLEIYYDEPVNTVLNDEDDKENYAITVDGKEIKLDNNLETETVYVSDFKDGRYVSDIKYVVKLKDLKEKSFFEEGNHDVSIYNSRDIVSNNGNGGNKDQLSKAVYTIGAVDEDLNVEVEAFDFNSMKIRFNKEVSKARVIVKKGGTEFFNEDIVNPKNKEGVEGSGGLYTIHLPYTVVSETKGMTPLYGEGEDSASVQVEIEEYFDGNKAPGVAFNETIELNRESIKPEVVDGEIKESSLSLKLNNYLGDKDVKTAKVNKNKVRVYDKDGINRTVESIELNNDNNSLDIKLKNMDLVKDGNKELREEKAYVHLAPYRVEFAEEALEVKTDKIDVKSEALNADKKDEYLTDGSNYKKGSATATLYSDAFEVVVRKDSATNPASKYIEGVKLVKGPKDLTNDKNPLTNKDFTPNENGIVIEYKNPMDPKTAGNIDNYRLDGERFPQGTYISIDGQSKVVTIVLPKETFKNDRDLKLTITKDVKTAKGEMIVNNVAHSEHEYMSPMFTIVDNTAPVVEEANFIVKDNKQKVSNTFVVEFDEELDGKNVATIKNNYEFKVGNISVAIKDVEAKITDNKTTLKFVLEDTVNVYSGGSLVLKKGKDVAIKDVVGNAMAKDAEIEVSGKEVDKGATGTEKEYAKLEAAEKAVETAKQELEAAEKAVKEAKEELAEAVKEAKEKLAEAKKIKVNEKLTKAVEEAKEELTKAEKALEEAEDDKKEEAQQDVKDAQTNLKNAQNDVKEAEAKLEAVVKKAEDDLAEAQEAKVDESLTEAVKEAETKLAEAKKALENLKK